ncbi:hypothetical protein EIP91_008756 [Steccherinum ochraceum]|uniref:Uncharacterized protein n=1 Tax=Steccherinum ochraceum TaxID=92696 RepID=A0A4R0S072_9APHY|nr:hypothetical protein EIP91_008756 [Steccherinum ochraceum]
MSTPRRMIQAPTPTGRDYPFNRMRRPTGPPDPQEWEEYKKRNSLAPNQSEWPSSPPSYSLAPAVEDGRPMAPSQKPSIRHHILHPSGYARPPSERPPSSRQLPAAAERSYSTGGIQSTTRAKRLRPQGRKVKIAEPHRRPHASSDSPPSTDPNDPSDEDVSGADDGEGLRLGSLDDLLESGRGALDSVNLSSLQSQSGDLADQFPFISNILVEIQRIHPFISVAVVAFKIAFEFYLACRDNGQKIAMVYDAMTDMMTILFTLKRFNHKHAEAQSVILKLQRLSKTTAEDIQKCANTCDVYMKQRKATRTLFALKWKPLLARFIKLFSDRQVEFAQAINLATLNVAQDIQEAIRLLASRLEHRLASYEGRFTVLTQMEERRNARNNIPKVVQEMSQPLAMESRRVSDDHHLSPEQSISLNNASFQRKFMVAGEELSRQLDDMQRTLMSGISRVEKNVLDAMKSGLHNEVKHATLREMWWEMRWKWNVSTDRFVSTLRDYFREKYSTNFDPSALWAFKYIDIAWLQPISEALDEDSSGYITIGEINRFTGGCPIELGWSLPQWTAYWAIGWHLAANEYRAKIHTLVARMCAMVPYIHPENQPYVDRYLAVLQFIMAELTFGLRDPVPLSTETLDKFRPYIIKEETRIQGNLHKLSYCIDAPDTLRAIAGSGRIEQHLPIILYCLLKHHEDILKKAQVKKELDMNYKLMDARNAVRMLHTAMYNRVEDLNGKYLVTIGRHEADSKKIFREFAFGLFEHIHDNAGLWSMSRLANPGAMSRFRSPSIKKLEPLRVLDKDVLRLRREAGVPKGTIARSIVYHSYCICTECGDCDFSGSRFICLDCVEPKRLLTQAVDCCSLKCFQKTISSKGLQSHLPSHDLLKLRMPTSWIQLPAIYELAQKSLERGRTRLLSSAVAEAMDRSGGPQSKSKQFNSLEPPLAAVRKCRCSVCSAVFGPRDECWFCVTCENYFLCDSCDSQSLLLCRSCRKPYSDRAGLYSGHDPDDSLQCDECRLSSEASVPPSGDKGTQHLYTHPMVKCKARVVIPKEPSELDRIIALSKRNDETEKKLDDLVSNIQNLDTKLGAVSGLDSKVDRILQLVSTGKLSIHLHD